MTLKGSAKSIKNKKGILILSTIARCLEKIYNNPENPLIWLKVLIMDKRFEFKSNCKRLLREYDTKFQKVKSKPTVGIVERYNRTFTKKFYSILDIFDILSIQLSCDPSSPSFDLILLEGLSDVIDALVEDFNNSITHLLGISPAKAIKKKRVFAKPFKPQNGPISFDKEKLSFDTFVIYLLDPNKYEGERKHTSDMN